MIAVLCIFSFVMTPVKIRPRMDTLPVKVVPPDDCSPVHLQLCDDASQNTSANGHVAGEGALLVDVSRVDVIWGLESHSRVADVPLLGLAQATLPVQENRLLLLERSLGL